MPPISCRIADGLVSIGFITLHDTEHSLNDSCNCDSYPTRNLPSATCAWVGLEAKPLIKYRLASSLWSLQRMRPTISSKANRQWLGSLVG